MSEATHNEQSHLRQNPERHAKNLSNFPYSNRTGFYRDDEHSGTASITSQSSQKAQRPVY